MASGIFLSRSCIRATGTWLKNPTLLLLRAWWQCFLWLRAKEDTSCKRTGHLKVMEHLISFHPVLRCLLTLWRAPLPGFLTNPLFSQLACSIKHHLWLESSNARFSLEWWLSIVCPMNLEATSRTWGEDKGTSAGSCQAQHCSTTSVAQLEEVQAIFSSLWIHWEGRRQKWLLLHRTKSETLNLLEEQTSCHSKLQKSQCCSFGKNQAKGIEIS